MARVKRITQLTFYLPLTRLSTNGMSHPAFTPQPQSITALWPVLISNTTDIFDNIRCPVLGKPRTPLLLLGCRNGRKAD